MIARGKNADLPSNPSAGKFSAFQTALSWPQVHPVAEWLVGPFQTAFALSINANLKLPISVVSRSGVCSNVAMAEFSEKSAEVEQ